MGPSTDKSWRNRRSQRLDKMELLDLQRYLCRSLKIYTLAPHSLKFSSIPSPVFSSCLSVIILSLSLPLSPFYGYRSLQNEISAKQSISEELTSAKAQHLEAEKQVATRSKDVDDLQRQLDESRNENKKLIARLEAEASRERPSSQMSFLNAFLKETSGQVRLVDNRYLNTRTHCLFY